MGDLDTLANPSSELAVVTEMHAKRVEELRLKQVLLAESWAGSEERLGSGQSSLLSKLANSAAGYDESVTWFFKYPFFCIMFPGMPFVFMFLRVPFFVLCFDAIIRDGWGVFLGSGRIVVLVVFVLLLRSY